MVDGIHTVRPVDITIVGLTLVKEDSLDDTLFLGNLCQFDETSIGIAVVAGSEVLHPVWLFLQVSFIGTLVEEVDAGTAHSHGDGSHPDAVRQVGNIFLPK